MKGRNSALKLIGIGGLLLLFTSCNITLQIKDGDTAYELKKYVLASQLLQEDYSKAKNKEEKHKIALQIAKSYLAFSETGKAEFWYKRAMDTDIDPNDMLGYAMVLKQNEKYDEAINILDLFYQYDRGQRLITEGHTAACEEILEAKESETQTRILNLAAINTEHSEFAPMVDEGLMTYSSNQPGKDDTEDAWTGKGYANILSAIEISRENFQPNADWDQTYNTAFHEAVLAKNPDGTEIYFTRCGMDDDNKDVCKIYRSLNEFDEWSEPEQVVLFDDSTNVGHPFITADGKQLYFSSDATFGYGGKDIYVSTRIGIDWEPPINLGPRVNTNEDEMFPHIDEDGKLYFASSGHFGYGGLDLFYATKRDRFFTNVQHLPYPINTGRDDFGIDLITSTDDSVEITGYLSSNRTGGIGSDDIYFFEKRLTPEIKLPPPVIVLRGLIEEKEFEIPDNPNSTVKGMKTLPGVAVKLTDKTDNSRPYQVGSFISDENGRYETILDQHIIYLLNFSKNGYFSLRDEIRTTEIQAENGDTVIINKNVVMERIFKEIEFTINNIYYDLDSANIRPDAGLVLDSLSIILVENPGMRVELGSHTDSRGSDSYNLDLSQRRAESAVAYLISNGISPGRLTAKGYGETRLVNECANNVTCTEAKHQENRRTTFKVLGLDFELKSEEE